MSLSLLDSIILRSLVSSPYTTKGSEITWDEEDTNFVIFANAIKELAQVEIGGVSAYNPATEYSDGDLVTYNNNTWEYIFPTPATGQTPSLSSAYWSIASIGAYSHVQNTDTLLASGTANEVTAAEIRAFIDAGAYDDTSVFYKDGSRAATGDFDMGGFDVKFNDNTGISDSFGNELVHFVGGASAVNFARIENANTNFNPRWTVAGDDTNIGATFATKGTGTLVFEKGSDGFKRSFLNETLTADRDYTLPDKDITVAGIDNETFTGTTNLATVVVSTSLTVASDTDATTILGRARLHSTTSDFMMLSHWDHSSASSYAIRQGTAGHTTINSVSGQTVRIAVNNTAIMTIGNTATTSTVPIGLASYTVAGVPSATTAGQIIYVSNESGGAVLAFSDGTNWRRVTDRAIIS